MLNRVMLIGRVGQDPKIINMSNGKKMATFNVATSEYWKDKQTGERKEKTEWHSIISFQSVEFIEKYLTKGKLVYVDGSLQTRQWEDNNGVKRFNTDVVINIGGKIDILEKAEKSSTNVNQEPTYTQPEGMSNGAESYSDLLDDDVPFN